MGFLKTLVKVALWTIIIIVLSFVVGVLNQMQSSRIKENVDQQFSASEPYQDTYTDEVLY